MKVCTTCTKCDISVANRSVPIQGDGSSNALIMFVGRAPTYQERKANIPFINNGGMYFQLYLDAFNLSRDEIYITYAVKCKTPADRHPDATEIHNCNVHLKSEIDKINPKIIVLLGATAIRSYFNLAYTETVFNLNNINGHHVIHNGRIIIFSYNPGYVLNHKDKRLAMYNMFVKLISFVRVINPYHTTRIGV